jgi:TRAP-type C4-dicarboxylate transport system permease small subunit
MQLDDNIFVKIVNGASHKLSILGVAALTGLMLLTVSDVLLRYFFDAPILGSYEVTELTMIVIVYPGLAWVAVKRANIKIDLVVGRLSPRTQGILDSIVCFLSLCIIGLLAYFSVPQAIFIMGKMTLTDELEIPLFPFYFLIALGFVILFFAVMINLIEFIWRATKG